MSEKSIVNHSEAGLKDPLMQVPGPRPLPMAPVSNAVTRAQLLIQKKSTEKPALITAIILWIAHRTLMVLFIIHQYCLTKLINIWSLSQVRLLDRTLAKVPKHVLVRITRKHQMECHDILKDCIDVAEQHGIEYLTVLGAESMTEELLLGCDQHCIYRDHRRFKEGSSSASRLPKINIITQDQKQFFITELRRIKMEKPEFRFDGGNLLSEMSCFPQVDLVVSDKLNFEGCLPSQIGFAEIYPASDHASPRTMLEGALHQFSSCKQNFGK